MPVPNPQALLDHLCALPRETEWLEFKKDYYEPEEIGQYLSALANSAMLRDQQNGFLVYGVEDKTHAVVGTDLRLRSKKEKGEPLELWLSRWLDPRINIELVEFDHKGRHIEMIIVEPAYERPVLFKNEAYIRIDSAKKPLREFPHKHALLWEMCSRKTFEERICADHWSIADIVERFHCDELMQALKRPVRSQKDLIEQLAAEGLIIDDKQGRFDITNLFAIVAARNLDLFPSLQRKVARVIVYKGKDKLDTVSDETGKIGIAISFSRIMKYIMQRSPHQEVLRHGIRETDYTYPEVSVREFLANALIHQDLSSKGDSPLVEIYSNRVEITNPGVPLIKPERFIDNQPKSRNERLAGLMRRAGICEERGRGVKLALWAIEAQSLPPPLFRQAESSTVVTLFKETAFSDMRKEDRIRACYQHAVLRFMSTELMSNSSLRARFGLSEKQYQQVSGVIAEAIAEGWIKPFDTAQGNRNARYVPYWAT